MRGGGQPSRTRSTPRRSDRQLLRLARRGSREAADELIGRHWGRAHRIAFGILGDEHEAEDVTQEAMLSLVTNIGRFDPYRPFPPWLHRIVTNQALDSARARKRCAEDLATPLSAPGEDGARHDVVDRGGRTEPGGHPSPDSASDPALQAALAKLSPEHRAVIVLRFVAGYGPKETGKVLGIPTGTVGSRLRRALDQLRVELEAEDG